MIFECNQCGAFVEAEEAGAYQYPAHDRKPGGRYVLLKCLKCGEPSLVLQENVGNMAEGDIWDTPVALFPNQGMRVNPSAPKPIRQAYEEASRCFRSGAYAAAAIMCRRTLEGICEVHSAKARNLAKSLEKLKSDGTIDARLFEWADELRIAGNEAAHDVNAVTSKRDAADMLEFTNAILDYLFSFRDKFVKFKDRRKTKAK